MVGAESFYDEIRHKLEFTKRQKGLRSQPRRLDAVNDGWSTGFIVATRIIAGVGFEHHFRG